MTLATLLALLAIITFACLVGLAVSGSGDTRVQLGLLALGMLFLAARELEGTRR